MVLVPQCVLSRPRQFPSVSQQPLGQYVVVQGRQFPCTQLRPLLPVTTQSTHAAPERPHARPLGALLHAPSLQHPAAQLVGLHATHCWLWQVRLLSGRPWQSVQAAPAPPHAVAAWPKRQTGPSQQPVGHVCALHPAAGVVPAPLSGVDEVPAYASVDVSVQSSLVEEVQTNDVVCSSRSPFMQEAATIPSAATFQVRCDRIACLKPPPKVNTSVASHCTAALSSSPRGRVPHICLHPFLRSSVHIDRDERGARRSWREMTTPLARGMRLAAKMA